ncbi:MAG: apolipoprotein N-acyltransferase [Bacteroidetes bacterium]|nr:apolipoprotein N-acyltransferase [Rhodothermia bacterium]MCS7155026.1 apolipoprotein N-acyltransferase [Bacteroidota bacterium]MCX7907310.1 apolipoprotein N-acyltransferase [Bacteroidota bacterium]MDW8137963.1 apolipoprotein N-acyltransferase [Bacteroidota bacterium]MDW8286185.1 apolipoprotein N-acyltransferase [Bacteroidota bacterium]
MPKATPAAAPVLRIESPVSFVDRHPMLAGLFGGLLLGLAFPPISWAPLAWVGLIPFFRIAETAPSAFRAAARAWPGLLLWNVLVTYWLLFNVVPAGAWSAAAVFPAHAAVQSLCVGLANWVRRRSERVWLGRSILLASWIGLEWLHFRWELRFPWLVLGNSLADWPLLAQFVDLTGVLGASAWIGAWNLWAYHGLHGRRDFRWALLGWLLFVLPVSYGAVRMGQWERAPRTNPFGVVQPNVDPGEKFSTLGPQEQLKRLLQASWGLLPKRPLLIVWPETAIPEPIWEHQPSDLLDSVQAWVDRHGVPVLTGYVSVRFYPDPDQAPRSARRAADGRPFDAFNSAALFEPGRPRQRYDKIQLVPFAERVPFLDQLPILAALTVDLGGVSSYGVGRRTEPFTLSNGLRLAPLICYESVFDPFIRRFVRQGAQLLVVITNDGWWGDTGGYRQHFAYARLRAIAFRRAVVRAANTGISGFILPSGRVLARTAWWKPEARLAAVPLVRHQSLYAHLGDWPGTLALTWLGLGLAYALWSRRSFPPFGRSLT